MYEIDARGLPCPESVVLTVVTLKKHKEEPVKVLISEPHIRMNVEKYARSWGKTATVTKKGSEFKIVIEQYRCPGPTTCLNQGF